jgi:hypothetical protein
LSGGTFVNANELILVGQDIYVGGEFTSVGGQARNNLAKLSTTGTGAADPSWAPNPNNSVFALALAGSDLYVGGQFTSIGGQVRNNLAKLSITGTGTIDPSWAPNPNGSVFALALAGQELYVGGVFTNIGGQPRTSLAKLTTTGTGAADASWAPNTNVGGVVRNLVVAGMDLFVGGRFSSLGGQSCNNLAKLSTLGSGAVDSNWRPSIAGEVYNASFAKKS